DDLVTGVQTCALPISQPALHASLIKADFTVITAQMPAGEEHKTIEGTSKLYDSLLRAGIERSTPILALGGGVIGDTVGFVAATKIGRASCRERAESSA